MPAGTIDDNDGILLAARRLDDVDTSRRPQGVAAGIEFLSIYVPRTGAAVGPGDVQIARAVAVRAAVPFDVFSLPDSHALFVPENLGLKGQGDGSVQDT